MNMINLQLFIFFYFYQMEFNVLPRAKILSPHSFHKSNQTTNQTVNVILQPKSDSPKSNAQPTPTFMPTETDKPTQSQTTNEHDHELEDIKPVECEYNANPYKALEPGEVEYKSRDVVLDEPAETLTKDDATATINFLKLVVNAYMANPIKYNGYVICSVPVLENMIETLTSCDDCSIDVAEIETGCCGTTKLHIVPIGKIWVRNGETSDIFKYKYSQFLQTFEQFNISLKFALVD